MYTEPRAADPVGAGSGKFSPDLDPIGTLAMFSCINKGKIF